MSLGRHATYNLIGQVAPLVVSLATVPVYLHLVGVERYGVIAIAWMLLGYFGLFDLGLTRAVIHRIASLRDAPAVERAQTFWTAVSVAAALAAAGAVLLYVGGRWYFAEKFAVGPALRQEALDALPILSMVLPLAILSGVLNGSLLGRERFLDMNAITVATSITAQLVPVAVAWLVGPRLSWLLASSLAVQALSLLVSFAKCRAHVFAGERFSVSRAEVGALMRFGGWITVSATVSPLMSLADRFVIGSLVNAAAVTTYAVPAQLAQRASIIPNSLASALFPKLSAQTDAEAAAALARTSTRVAGAIMTPLVLAGIVAMGPFLTLWLRGTLGHDATTIGQVLLIGWWINGLGVNPYTLLQAGGRPRTTALLHIAELPVYGALLWWLILLMGPVGAAVAFALRCALDTLALQLIAYGRRIDLLVYLPAAALLFAAVPLIGPMRFDVATMALAAALVAAEAIWSLLVLPPHLRQSLSQRLFHLTRSRHAETYRH